MRIQMGILLAAALLLTGCSTQSTPMTGQAPPANPAPSASMIAPTSPPTTTAPADAPKDANPATAAAQPTPVALTDGSADLTPENTKIEFVGTHVGEKPDPRLGGFEKFTGKVTTADGKLTAVSIDISTESLWSQIGDKLTTHLKSPDFLDTKEYPEIKLQSTSVESADGKATISGDLTLHGVTKPIKIPATVTIGENGVTVVAEFTIDRSEFDMTTALDKVDKTVSLTVIVGEKTEPKSAK